MTDINEVTSAFERLDLSAHDPKWSSGMLEQLFDTVLGQPRATMTDLFRGFDIALRRNDIDLTETLANLVKDVVVTGFTRYKSDYGQEEWGWANDELAHGVSAARAYLFLLALPPDQAKPVSLVSILRSLEGTSRFDEAVATLSEDFERPEVQQELQRWRINGMRPQTADKLHVVV